jgi:ankyrin repeat protein
MQSLLKHGAVIDLTEKNGMTPLHLAAASYNPALVYFLVRNGADALRRTKDGKTPMQIAQRSEAGTGVLGITIPEDVKRKSATVEVLRRVVAGRAMPR